MSSGAMNEQPLVGLKRAREDDDDEADTEPADRNAALALAQQTVPGEAGTAASSASATTAEEDGKWELCRADRRKLKKQRKLADARAGDTPACDVLGPDARVELKLQLENNRNQPLSASQIQELLLWTLTSVGKMPAWLFVRNKSLVRHVVVLMVNSLGPATYLRHTLASDGVLAPLPRLFPLLAETDAPGGRKRIFSFTNDLFAVPLRASAPQTKAGRGAKHQPHQPHQPGAGAKGAASTAAPACLPSQFVLSADELALHEFPLGDSEEARDPTQGFCATIPAAAATGDACANGDRERLVALDCEMVRTSTGKLELARVALICGEDGSVLADMLVVPDAPILDYLTQYSGISAETLAGVTTRLADAQALVRRFVSAETILVGHSLENDLRALRLLHGRCIDTSVLFPDTRGPRYKRALRSLVQHFLKRGVAGASSGGHDPCEDARAALELTKLKLARGADFGAVPRESESLLELLAREQRRAAVIDRSNLVRNMVTGTASAFACATDAEAAAACVQALKTGEFAFVYAQLHDLEHCYGDAAAETAVEVAAEAAAEPDAEETGAASTASDDESTRHAARQAKLIEAETRVLRDISAHVQAIVAALPPHSVMVLISGQSNTARFKQMLKAAKDADMTAEDEALLVDEATTARKGLALFRST